MAGELEESKALLEAAVRGQRQVEQELSDTREQSSDMQGTTVIIKKLVNPFRLDQKCTKHNSTCFFFSRQLWIGQPKEKDGRRHPSNAS